MFDNYRLISESDFRREDARTRVKVGDVLLTIVGSIGRTAVVLENTPGFTLQRSVAVITPIEILPKYLMYHFQAPFFQQYLVSQARGTAQKGIYLNTLSASTMRIAPYNEQRRIVSAIETQFTRLAAAVASLERVQANLKRYRASVLKDAVEGRLVPTEAELARREVRNYEPASVLLERILKERRLRWEEAELAKLKAKGRVPRDDLWKKKYKEPVRPDVDGLPKLPEGWCWASLDQVSENHDYARVPVRKADRAQRQGQYSYYGASGAIDTIDDFLFDGSFLLVGEDGANLLARSTPIAFQAHGRFWVNNHAHVLTTIGGIPLDYLETFFNAIDLSRFVTGTAQPKLPQAAMNKIPVPLPPTAEQIRIMKTTALHLSLGDSTKTEARLSHLRVGRLRQCILKWAFDGKLVDQDPNDEPAAVLLERIRADRASPTNHDARRRRRRMTA